MISLQLILGDNMYKRLSDQIDKQTVRAIAIQMLKNGSQEGSQLYVEKSEDLLAPHLLPAEKGEEGAFFFDQYNTSKKDRTPEHIYSLGKIERLAETTIGRVKMGLMPEDYTMKTPTISKDNARLVLSRLTQRDTDQITLSDLMHIMGGLPSRAIAHLGNMITKVSKPGYDAWQGVTPPITLTLDEKALSERAETTREKLRHDYDRRCGI